MPVTNGFFIRNSTAAATSSGCPIRRTGKRLARSGNRSDALLPVILLCRGVSISPGATVLTRIGASSSAKPRPSDSTALHEAPITAPPGNGLCPATPVRNVIEPSGGIFGAAYLAVKKAPQKRVSIAALHL